MENLNFSWVIDGEIAGHSALLSNEDIEYLSSKGIRALIRMVEPHKSLVTSNQIEKLDLTDYHEPVDDFTAPNQNQIDNMIACANASVVQGKPVGVSCGAGIGRTGTVLICYLINKGYGIEEATEEVRRKRGTSVETDEQWSAVQAYAKRLGKQRK